MHDDLIPAEPAITYKIDSSKQIVYLTYAANPKSSDWKGLIDQILSHPDFKPRYNILSDRRKVPEANSEFLQSVIEYLAVCKVQGRWDGRWGVVLSSSSAVAQAKIIQNLLQPINVDYKMFTDFAEAERWLVASQTHP